MSDVYIASVREEAYTDIGLRNMSTAWAAFARSGNPSHPGIPTWPAYDTQRRPTMRLDAECRVVADPHREERLL